MTDLEERDANAAARAIKLLNLAGFDVDQVGNVKRGGEGGVTFKIDVSASTRYNHFWDRLEAVESAAVEADDSFERSR